MRIIVALSCGLLLLGCGGSKPASRSADTAKEPSGEAEAVPEDEGGGARVEKHTVVEKTPHGTVTRTITVTTREVEAPSPPPRPADPFPANPLVRYNVERVNAYRARKGLAPLLYDAKISAFALDGSRQLASDHEAHAHFKAHPKGGPGMGTHTAENQGDPNGAPPMESDRVANGKKQVDLLLQLMFDEGPGGGHYENMMSKRYRRIGVGLHEVGGKLYLTNDFSD